MSEHDGAQPPANSLLSDKGHFSATAVQEPEVNAMRAKLLFARVRLTERFSGCAPESLEATLPTAV